jgi:hypothetical protein
MNLPYRGVGELLEKLFIFCKLPTKENLTDVILNPYAHDGVWKKYVQYVGHDYHDLQLLHDTLCFIQESNGRVKYESIATLRDYFQDSDNYVGQCIIPALEELELITRISNEEIVLTHKGQKIQPRPRFLDIAVE